MKPHRHRILEPVIAISSRLSFRDLRRPDAFLATGFGVGLLPKIPGTYGSLLGALVWWVFLAGVPFFSKIIVVVTMLFIATGVIHSTCTSCEVEDDQAIVLDEISGLWIALLLLPSTLGATIIGLILFRIFDIWKPGPISWADQKIKGSFGIMLDDVIAGFFVLLVFYGARATIRMVG